MQLWGRLHNNMKHDTYFFASFNECIYLWKIVVENWPAHPGLSWVSGCCTEGTDLVKPLIADFIDLINPFFYNRLKFRKEVIE